MRESKFDWTKLFRPICVLCLPMGVIWAASLMMLPAEHIVGRLIYGAGGVLLLLAGIFGILGRPRIFVPLLDFLALVAGLAAFWQVGFYWQTVVSVVLAAFYLVSCNATTLIGDDTTENPAPDYSELHPWWENMEHVKEEYEAAQQAAEEKKASEEGTEEAPEEQK